MSYEIYVDVRHHPRHLDEWEQKLTDCAKLAEPQGATPSEAERMRAVCGFLRGMAERHDPDYRCSNCGELRSDHYGYGEHHSVRCFGQYGPYARWDWWTAPEENLSTPEPGSAAQPRSKPPHRAEPGGISALAAWRRTGEGDAT